MTNHSRVWICCGLALIAVLATAGGCGDAANDKSAEKDTDKKADNQPQPNDKEQPEPSKTGHPLTGQPAPDFSCNLLDGSKLTLSEHTGKNIIVLDFWATWCPPCVAALPKIDSLAKKFAGQGVEFYAVNVQEEPSQIKPFMTKKNLEIPVALDEDGNISELYQAKFIPQTVIIDKSGVVHDVHVGAPPNLDDELSRVIEDLLK